MNVSVCESVLCEARCESVCAVRSTGGFSNFECNLVMNHQVSDGDLGMDDVILIYPGPPTS